MDEYDPLENNPYDMMDDERYDEVEPVSDDEADGTLAELEGYWRQ